MPSDKVPLSLEQWRMDSHSMRSDVQSIPELGQTTMIALTGRYGIY